jgi:hypothetical protein
MSTPNDYTTDPIWDLWLGFKSAVPTARLGGIYANKPGYHNTRNAHFTKAAKEKGWDDNYSVQLSLDKQGPGDKAAGLDLTLSAANMKKYTSRLYKAMDDGDARVGSLKEFYGTVDGRTVVGLGKKSRSGEAYQTTSDSSHTWHIHLSFFRADVANRDRIMGVLDVLTGEEKPSKPAKPSQPSKPSKPSKGTKPAPTPHYSFPLPSGYYFGPKGGPKESVSGYYGRSFKGETDRTWLKRWGSQLGKRGWNLKRYLPSGNDGFFGPEYRSLVEAFQRDQGLVVDGKLGPKTWKAAFENPVS